MSHGLDDLDYYALLGVDEEASIVKIKEAFRVFARRYHPDRFAGAPPEKVERANAIYRRGTEAFQVLTDPVSRTRYDEALERGELRLTSEAREAAKPKPKAAPAAPRIRSAQARTLYDDAVLATKQQDWKAAQRALRGACQLEPESEFLRGKLAQLEQHLRTLR
ncbi:MAG: J domain-containing protein [Myxococcales bacterium]|nr:J domain-containing protein [Myxococcales bacterium]